MNASPAAPPQPSRRRKISLVAAAVLISMTLTNVAGELLIRLTIPQCSLYPCTQFSESYGFIPYPNTRMVHEVPGRWRFEYTTNEFGHRGPSVPVSNEYPRPVVVVLGDSYTFGVGVGDGQEYASVIREQLADRYDIANLGVEG